MFAGATIEHLDGFNELPEEFKAKVRRALDQGHVDDEDWKGVSTLIYSTQCHSSNGFGS